MRIKTHDRKWIDEHCKIEHTDSGNFAYIDNVNVGVWLNSYMEDAIVGKRRLKVKKHTNAHYPYIDVTSGYTIPAWLVR